MVAGTNMWSETITSQVESIGPAWESLERRLTAYYGDRLTPVLLELRLVTAESLVNAIGHAHEEDGRPLKIEAQFFSGYLLFRVIDSGPGFDWPEEVQDPLDLDAEGGRGVFLIDRLSDGVSYLRNGEHNVLTLRKNIPASEAKASKNDGSKSKRRVLLAEDDEDSRLLFSRLLEKLGCHVTSAVDGGEALAFLESERPFDAVLLDVMMPVVNGLEVLRAYRAMPKEVFVPVLLVTAKDAAKDIADGFDAGADEYVVKPVFMHELRARLNAAFRLKDMAAELKESADEFRIQLREARNLQNAVLPKPVVQFGDVQCSSVFRPCDYVGGDMVGYFPLDEQKIGIYVADVSGHGVPAAMFSMWLNRSLQPIPEVDGIVKKKQPEPPYYRISSPAEVCSSIDRLMGGGESEKYLTIFYAVLDTSCGSLEYCSAGHPQSIIFKRDGEICRLEGSSPPVGMGLGFDFENCCTTLERGDRLVAYSDCALETMSPSGEAFGEERLLESLNEAREKSSELQLNAVLDALRTHRHLPTFEDDLTLLSIHFKEKFR